MHSPLSTASQLFNYTHQAAALIDALAGYNYLVNTVGFHPTRIILEGDSAGGNLALALTRYLLEHRNPVSDLHWRAAAAATALYDFTLPVD